MRTNDFLIFKKDFSGLNLLNLIANPITVVLAGNVCVKNFFGMVSKYYFTLRDTHCFPIYKSYKTFSENTRNSLDGRSAFKGKKLTMNLDVSLLFYLKEEYDLSNL